MQKHLFFIILCAAFLGVTTSQAEPEDDANVVWAPVDQGVNILGTPSSRATVLRTTEPGARLEIVRDEGRYTLISETINGRSKRGWVLSESLSRKPPSDVIIERLQSQVSNLQTKQASLQARNNELSENKNLLEQQLRQIRDAEAKLSEQYTTLRDNSDNVIGLTDKNAALQKQTDQLQQRIQQLESDNVDLQDMQMLYWGLAGAGILIVGILLGLLLPKLNNRKDDRWLS